MKRRFLFLSALFLVCIAFSQEKSSFVWTEPTGTGRQVVVYYRNDFTLDKTPEKAIINLFADSRYHLFVNGTFLNFGPERFFPQEPEYDSYDIAPYLRVGKNTIGVKALSYGVPNYQMPKHIGGFIAWGEIKNTGKTISFETPGSWICKASLGYDRTTPKISFALQAMESFDARQDQPDWNLPEADTRGWQKPVLIANQKEWGKMKPRTIPHLTQDEIIPKKLLGAYEIKDDYSIYSFRISTHDVEAGRRIFAYTYIYSPKAQKTDMVGWWSEYWLNGDSVGFDQPENLYNKRIWHLNLKEGWNYLFIKYDAIWGSWEAYFGIPKNAGLVLSGDKKTDSEIFMYTAGPFNEKEEKSVRTLKLPLTSPDKLPKLSATWMAHKSNESAGNPVWNIAWDDLGNKQNFPESLLPFYKIEKPTAFIFDIGGKKLARFFTDIDAPAGTTVDVAFTEDTLGFRPWVYKRPSLHIGAHFVTREGKNHFETFNPYGCRFVQVNIKNNQNKPVTLYKTGVISQVYPLKKLGSFECSDPMMNAIWEIGWRTLVVCSEDSYIDTPVRERGLYADENLPQFGSSIAVAGDTLLLKRSFMLYEKMYAYVFDSNLTKNKKRSDMGNGELEIIVSYGWYVNRTKDLSFAKTLYPSYKTFLTDAIKNTQANGLIETNRIFVEWTDIKPDNYSSTYANAFYAASCEAMAMVAQKLGYKNDVVWFTNEARKVSDAIRKYCWDEKKGAFYDGVIKDKPVESYYPISSGIVSLFGYTTPEQEKRLKFFFDTAFTKISDEIYNRRVTPFGAFYELGGLYRHENADIAERFIRKYYSVYVLKVDDTMWEDFADGKTNNGFSMSHAWSSAPTYYLTAYVLGVQLGFPTNFDADEIRIEPQAESITWAKGDVPHPKGIIHVEWVVKGENLFLNYSAPAGLNVKVNPRGKLAHYILFVNGIKK